MSVDLSIIIVNWNGIKFLPNCLKSIVENPPSASFEIVLVDNDSSDKSVEWLKSDEAKEIFKDTNFKLIESKENLGFGKGNNLAIEYTHTPYVFLLNPDTIAKPDTIDRLLKTLQSDEKIGMAAPKLVGSDGATQSNAWSIPNATKIIVEGLKLYKIIPKQIRSRWSQSGSRDYDKQQDTPLVSGAAMMVKRVLINEVGGFDPSIFMYGEDFEWCMRIGRNGWRIIYDPDAEIIHLGGQSSVQMWGENDTRMKEEEASLNFQLDCFPAFLVLRTTFARILVLSLYYIFSILRGKKNSQLEKVILLQMRGFKKAFRNLF